MRYRRERKKILIISIKEEREREKERYAAVANSVKGRKRWEKSGRRSARFQLGCANVEDSRVQKQLFKIVLLLYRASRCRRNEEINVG